MSNVLRVGLEVDAKSSPELGHLIETALGHGYDYVTASLTNSKRRPVMQINQEGGSGKKNNSNSAAMQNLPENRAFNLDEVVLDRVDWAASVVGRHAAWAAPTSEDTPAMHATAEMTLQRETAWAAHLGLSAMILALPALLTDVPDIARYVNQITATPSYTQLWIHTSMASAIHSEGTDPVIDEDVSWERWSLLRLLCGHHASASLCLELTTDLPEESKIARWLSEPIVAIVLPDSVWLQNAKGFPVLSKLHQALLHQVLKRSVDVIIRTNTPIAETRVAHYQQYIRHLAQNPPPLNACEAFAAGYQDYLQTPLQPLMDNLESSTYQVFEQDPIKYAQYEEAVYQALLDRVPQSAASTVTTTIMVVGAGRGPLVSRCLQAASRAERLVRVFAIEKNPNAYVTLQKMNKEVWAGSVTVVWTDMREWETTERADILVSELLGSFGDNELSPECLDGAQQLLKADGISIPESYTSYIAPLSSAKLHKEVASLKSKTQYETPYVVLFSAVHQAAEPQATWTFDHPLKDPKTQQIIAPRADNMHNIRYSSNTFTLTQAAMIHGIAGYFDTVLYKDVTLSILPSTASDGMFSWFPILFPVKVPLYAPADTIVDVHFWRRTNCKKLATSRRRLITASSIHNTNGEMSWIGL
ncbi:PRMT5 arginine-N-methyltransferase-domain-containing protein [Syncephalis fuscata]|nr:PRMT5 arginine-N-methyltransferase-domain-containing protein [Syncephalis fuscata]